MKYSDGMKILDMLPMGYNAEYVKNLFVTLGENGRHTYLFEQIPFDMIYPGLFGLTYSLIIFYLSKKINFDNLSIYKIALLPMFAGIFDYLENIGVIFLLTKFPDLNEKVVGTSSLFSLGKSLFTTLTFLTIITLLFLMVSKKIKMNKK
ncbi:hypothetical protein [Lutibacter maritimus]|nr:hypothetical protein [Lutibacter maritimus]